MAKIDTFLQDQWATDLDIYRELNKRMDLDEGKALYLRELETKQAGIDHIVEQIEKYAEEDWIVMTDFVLSPGIPDIQVILVTKTASYIFQCPYEERESIETTLERTQTIQATFDELGERNRANGNLQGVSFFTEEDIEDVEGVNILNSTTLEEYIIEIAEAEKITTDPPLNTEDVFYWLTYYEVKYFGPPMPLDFSIIESVESGIICRVCEGFDTEIVEEEVVCACGEIEPLEDAVIRTALEWGKIHHNKSLFVGNIHFFIGINNIRFQTVHDYMDKHFVADSYSRRKKNQST